MSYEIKKPITEKQRVDFIVEYNGLKFEDTEMFLFALEADEIMGEKEIEIEGETVTIPYPVKNPDYPTIELAQAKTVKIAENDAARDTALYQGVVYKNVLFDSDTDQKINLLAIVSTMSDVNSEIVNSESTGTDNNANSELENSELTNNVTDNSQFTTHDSHIIWYGKDNQPLTCSKEDLINIGGLITQLHSFCWNKNAEIKSAIAKAKTLNALNKISIDYTLPADE